MGGYPTKRCASDKNRTIWQYLYLGILIKLFSFNPRLVALRGCFNPRVPGLPGHPWASRLPCGTFGEGGGPLLT